MTENEYYMVEQCLHCSHYKQKKRVDDVYGNDLRFQIDIKVTSRWLCELYGNTGAFGYCDCFNLSEQSAEALERYNGVLLTKEEAGFGKKEKRKNTLSEMLIKKVRG